MGYPFSRPALSRPALSRQMLVLLLAWLPAAASLAAVSARIVATDPAATETLNRGDALYVRIAYDSDMPVRFQVDGFANGERIGGAATNPAPVYPAGQGEAIVWLSLYQPVYMDEVRVRVNDAHWEVQQVLSQPVSLYWERQPRASPRVEAPWVRALSSEQQSLARAAQQAAAATEGFDVYTLLVMLMGWSVPGYLVLQVYMLSRYRGGWRKAAMAPLALMVPLLAYTVFALLAGSNLWPLLLIFLTPLTFVYLVALGLVKRGRG
jgi:hypothetical protein